MGGIFGGGKSSPAPVQVPEPPKDTGPAPVDNEAAATAKIREEELKKRKGRQSLRVDMAGVSGASGGAIGSGVSIA